MNIAELSLKRPVSAIMFFVSLMVIGLIATFRLPLEFFPAVDVPFAFVDIPYPNSTPAEVERTITRPVEEVLSTLSGIKRMNSTSRADGAQIFLEFKWGKDVELLASEAREKIDGIRDDLPSDLQRYFVRRFSPGDEAILKVRLSSTEDLTNSYDLIDRKFKRPLERLPGVARVEITGVAPSEVQIELLSDRVTAYGINLNELAQRLRQTNFSTSAGIIRDSDLRFRVQPIGEFRNLDEIRQWVINDKGLRLSDIANVRLQPARLDVRRHLDMRPTIGLDIFKERNANLVDVGQAALEESLRIAKDPELKNITPFIVEDQAAGVTSSLKELAEAGLIGAVLSLLTLYYFLRHWPSTLMVTMAVPLCFIITLGLMYFLGLTLNVLSMMGLLLGVGMVVDNAVVAVESIYQQREKFPHNPPKASIIGVRNVAIALSAGTLCHCIVFLPNIFSAKNMISIFMFHVAVAICISLLASWLVAISLVPMISARLAAPSFLHRDSFVSRLKERYARFIAWTLLHRGKTVFATLLVLLISLYPATQTKFDMFPAGDTRRLNLQYDLKGDYRLDEIERAIQPIEEYLVAHKKELEIESVYTWMSEQFGLATNLKLIEKGATRKTADIMEDIRKGLPKLAIGTVGFGEQQRGGGNGEGLQVSLTGDSSEVLRELSQAVLPILSHTSGVRDARNDEGRASQEVAVRIDRERAAQYGFSAQEVATFIAIALRGTPLKEFRAGEREIPVWLRFQNADAQRVEHLSDYKLRKPGGELIPLMSLIETQIRDSASTIQRQDRQTSLALKINLADGATASEVRTGIEQAMKKLTLPAGYGWKLGGGFNDSDEAGQQMLFNTLIALIMIYVVMAALFESLIFPAAILMSIIFSIFGVFWLFWITDTTFSIMASIGILILMGVVVNNGIVMVEHINQLRHEGMLRTPALIAGSRDRLRPVLMTMGTAILGMIPLCVSTTTIGGNGPPYYPMARAIAGGLIFSTVITLLVLPVIYSLLDDMRLWMRNIIRDARAKRLWVYERTELQ